KIDPDQLSTYQFTRSHGLLSQPLTEASDPSVASAALLQAAKRRHLPFAESAKEGKPSTSSSNSPAWCGRYTLCGTGRAAGAPARPCGRIPRTSPGRGWA